MWAILATSACLGNSAGSEDPFVGVCGRGGFWVGEIFDRLMFSGVLGVSVAKSGSGASVGVLVISSWVL
jgi:hypothetical protein